MKALSILQPFAWLIVHGHKDVENRTWYTPMRGRILVHAGKRYPRGEHDYYVEWLREEFDLELPRYEEIPRGALVGAVDIVDCRRNVASPWKDPESWGFVLANAAAVSEPTPWRGQLGFFDIPYITGVSTL